MSTPQGWKSFTETTPDNKPTEPPESDSARKDHPDGAVSKMPDQQEQKAVTKHNVLPSKDAHKNEGIKLLAQHTILLLGPGPMVAIPSETHGAQANPVVKLGFTEAITQPSDAEQTFNWAAVANNEGGFNCPNCGHLCAPGTLICSKCQMSFVSASKTHRLEDSESPIKPDQNWPIGEVFVEQLQPINFDINGQTLILPSVETMVIGRLSDTVNPNPPDVALNDFRAEELGVSRAHIRISHSDDMIYVMDLKSSNGTYLNGQRLTPDTPRLLRNGDELYLGHLKIQVSFKARV